MVKTRCEDGWIIRNDIAFPSPAPPTMVVDIHDELLGLI
jgi:hypothetical protein